jgi:hypothetical protein
MGAERQRPPPEYLPIESPACEIAPGPSVRKYTRAASINSGLPMSIQSRWPFFIWKGG